MDKSKSDTAGGGLFEKHKAHAIREWEERYKTTKPRAALRKQAQIMQVNLEGETQDERAKTEPMPSDKFTPAKLSAGTRHNLSSRAMRRRS